MGVDVDGGLIRLVIDGGLSVFEKAERMGVASDVLKSTQGAAWSFISDYVHTHGEMPGLDLVEGSTGGSFPTIGANLEHLATHLMKRRLWQVEKKGLERLTRAMEHKDPLGARNVIVSLAEEVVEIRTGSVARVKNLLQAGPAVLKRYEDTKEGKVGVPLPWPSMNAMTMGLHPKTVTLFFARPGTGKTWCLLICARHAWLAMNAGYEVSWGGNGHLIVSPEMDTMELAERFFAVDTSMSYRDMVGGQLGDYNEKRLAIRVEELKEAHGIYVIDDPRDLYPDRIEEAILDLNPASVWLDSVYDIRVGRGSRQDRMAAISEWMRRGAKRTNKPWCAASQLNRSQEGKKRGSMSGAALTDQVSWDAHNLIAMIQTEDMRDDGILLFDPMKVRRAAYVKRVLVQWDFDTMSHGELSTSDKEEFKDSGFDDDDWKSF